MAIPFLDSFQVDGKLPIEVAALFLGQISLELLQIGLPLN